MKDQSRVNPTEHPSGQIKNQDYKMFSHNFALRLITW